MKPIFYFVPALCIWAASSAAQAAEPAPHIEPPALVFCKTDATCDRDPAHLEQFVAGFYKWYVANEEELFSIGNTKQEIRSYAHETRKIMRARLTADFMARGDKNYAPADPLHCAGTADFILCLQDYDNDWMYQNAVRLLNRTKNRAELLLTLLPPHAYGYSGGPIERLVFLKVERSVWRVDGVKEPESELHNGK